MAKGETLMHDMQEKINGILHAEELFAKRLALKVIERPKLSIWMILIPIIFLHYFYRFQKFNTGQKRFVENYMISIRRALNEAVEVVENGKKPDPGSMASMSDVPEAVRKKQADVYAVMLEHYIDLLRSKGDDVAALIRRVYQKRTNYLLFLNRLNRVEKDRNSALKPLLYETTDGVNEIVEQMERFSEILRREMAEKIFPSG